MRAVTARGGSGVIVLPCGAGKTIVGMACMAEVQASTLVLTTNVTATRQWVAELLDKTTLQADQVGEYNGSRQEEAQRLGRILRPKPGANQAHFYTIVTRDTVEQDFALKRQLFLCEQGYAYEIRDAGENGGEK